MIKTLFLSIITVLMSGCALTTDHIDLSYSPQIGVTKIPDASNIVISVLINDQRQGKKNNMVGYKKGGYGTDMGSIIANEDVTVTIRRAIEQELQSRGFSIGNEASISIIVELVRFWNVHQVGVSTFSFDSVSDLNMKIRVKNKKEDLLYNRYIQAEGIEHNNQLATGDNARASLNNALYKGLKLLFEDQVFVDALLDVRKRDNNGVVKKQ